MSRSASASLTPRWSFLCSSSYASTQLACPVPQVSSSTYNLDANLALLRFYQFAPSTVKIITLAKVLLKALMQLPSPDYKTCIYLIPERIQVRPCSGSSTQAPNSVLRHRHR